MLVRLIVEQFKTNAQCILNSTDAVTLRWEAASNGAEGSGALPHYSLAVYAKPFAQLHEDEFELELLMPMKGSNSRWLAAETRAFFDGLQRGYKEHVGRANYVFEDPKCGVCGARCCRVLRCW